MSIPSSQAGALEVSALIDARPLSPMQIGVVFLCALVALLDGYDIQVMALAVPSVAHEWGVAPSSFGWALTASLIGIGLGGAVVAPFADRIGRRPVLIAAIVVVAVCTLAAAFSHSTSEFVVWRLLTGIGLGASQPIAATLTSEYAPIRRRSLLVTIMFCNVAFGAFGAGLSAPALMTAWGWRGLFLAGGLGTLALAVLLLVALPESLRFLLARRPGHTAIARILARLAPGEGAGVYIEPVAAQKRSVFDLVGRTYLSRTALLWTIYSLNCFVTYMMISWLPTLLRQAGWDRDQASLGIAIYQLGSVLGGLALSGAVDSGRPIKSLVWGYGVSAAALALLNFVPHGFWTWGALIGVIGGGIAGAQFILVALATAFYPVSLRGAGVGWAGTVSRTGAVSAPLVGAWLIKAVAPGEAMALMIVPALMCAALALLIRRDWWAAG